MGQESCGRNLRYDSGTIIEPDWSIIGVEPTKLRTWQRDCVTEAWTFLVSGLRYTKVGLQG